MKSAKSQKSQVDKFREAARELETDESEENFDRALKRIAVVPSKPNEKQKPTIRRER